MNEQRIIIIVINFGTIDFLHDLMKSFITSLPTFLDARIDWVITDAVLESQVNEQEWIETMREKYKNKKKNFFHFFQIPNRGFAYNVNLSWKLFKQKLEYYPANNDLVLLLNPDTTMYWINLEKAVNFFKATPDASVAGMALTNPRGQLEKWGHSMTFPTLKLFFKSKRFSRPSLANEPIQVAWVSGGAMLVKAKWWEKMQGLDENFFMYFEDVDFCKRVTNQGGKIYFLPQAIVNHRRGGSDISLYRRKLFYYASEAKYFHLYHSSTEFLLLRFLRFPYKIFYFLKTYLPFSFWKNKFVNFKNYISRERKEGFPGLKSLVSSFQKFKLLKQIWAINILLILVLLGESFWGKYNLSAPLILHYNVNLGIDFYGPMTFLFRFPLLALLMCLINFVLSIIFLSSKKYKNLILLPAGTSMAFIILLIIALTNFILLNR